MTIDELNNITKLTNRHKIKKALRAAGYFDIVKHPTLRDLSLIHLANGTKQDGAEYLTKNGKLLFDGQIITHVNSAEDYEFAIVNIYETPINPDGEAIQIRIMMWAREKNSLNPTKSRHGVVKI